ncbi:MAG: hypothetical protein ACYC4P_11600 [Thermoanaerobaculia bacterium]
MLDLEDSKELAALSGERRLRLIQGGDPRLEPREAEVLLFLVDELAARGFDVFSGLAAVASDPVRFAPRFASGDLSKLVSIAPNEAGEGARGSRDVAPLPSLTDRRNPISAVSALAGTLARARS